MLMIPLPFVLAVFIAAFAIYEWLSRGVSQRGGWLLAFLAVLIFQEGLVGLRFGYGLDDLRRIQPLSAAMLPPLAYLSFRRPAISQRVAVHLLPLAGVIASALWLPGMLDTVLALSNLAYAAALIRLGLRGVDGLGWVETHRERSVVLLLWLVGAILLLSGLADAAIAFDFWRTQGNNTGQIVGGVTAFGMLTLALCVVFYRMASRNGPYAPPQVSAEDSATFDDLGAMMRREQLHLDPDINLNRVARRLVRPAREVSRAINSQTDGNFSQYINGLRIEEACRLLQGDMPITQIVFASGFNTKSNFNREFSRILGCSPRDWRAAHC